jgi:cellulose synthase/poly-beta-1,6-N-acetylglucosamine synthase-like glycosyltransferase
VLIQGEKTTSIETAIGGILNTIQAKYSLIVKAGTFPGVDWLESAYIGAIHDAAGAVCANTGRLSSSHNIDKSWMNVFALTSVLKKGVLGQNNAAEYKRKIDFLLVDVETSAVSPTQLDAAKGLLHVVSTSDLLSGDSFLFTKNVCVVMPCISLDAGRRTANLLAERSGLPADFVLAVDTDRQGFIPTLNQAARRSSAQYIVYLAQDAWPGDGWLRCAYDRIRHEKKSLVAFNCGKWHGRVAAFGMVEKSWAYSLYGDEILFGGYQSHRADNELTVIARAQDRFVYAPECVLIENDTDKVFRRSEREAGHFRREDAQLFRQRFRDGFSGLADRGYLGELHDEYLNLPAHYAAGRKVEIS